MSGIVLATGDLAPDREDLDACFAATTSLLQGADVVLVSQHWGIHFVRAMPAIPLWIDRDAVPRPLSQGDERYDEVLQYQRAVTQEAGLITRFAPRQDRIVLEPAT